MQGDVVSQRREAADRGAFPTDPTTPAPRPRANAYSPIPPGTFLGEHAARAHTSAVATVSSDPRGGV